MQSAPLKLPGTHRVKKSLAGGRVAFYWYRTRGGDLLMKFVGDTLAEARAAEIAGATALARAYGTPPPRPHAGSATVRGLIIRYRAAPDGFVRLAKRTKENWRRSLDMIDAKFGDLPLKALSAKGAGRAMIAWRNGFKDTPRQADAHMTVLKRLLSWGVENFEIDSNPVEGVAGIYSSNRAALIVDPDALEAILQKATPQARLAIRFAAATGVRREDVCEMEWGFLHGSYLKFATNKSGERKTVVVPLLGDARAVVEEVKRQREVAISEGRVPSKFMFLTDKKTPWKPDSLTQAFSRAANAAGVTDRTFNDLRGTAITKFVIAKFSNEEIADIVGWQVARVSDIRKHYVDAENVAQGLIDRLERHERTG